MVVAQAAQLPPNEAGSSKYKRCKHACVYMYIYVCNSILGRITSLYKAQPTRRSASGCFRMQPSNFISWHRPPNFSPNDAKMDF